MKKICKSFCVLFTAAVMMLTLFCCFASAQREPLDPERTTGNIVITPISVDGDDELIKNTQFTVYKVFGLSETSGRIKFAINSEFLSSGVTSENVDADGMSEKLAAFVSANNIRGITKSADLNGTVRFNGLPFGLYLVVQSSSGTEFSQSSPFIISVPSLDGDRWVYEVDASPKTDIVRLVYIKVKKVWNDGGLEHPSGIDVRLMLNGEVQDTVRLNEENNWQHTWENYKKSDGYTVEEVNVPTGYTVAYSKNNFEFTVTNSSTLIHTGQLNWPVPILGGCGFTVFAMGWAMVFSGKRKKDA